MYVRFTTRFRKKFFVGQAPQNSAKAESRGKQSKNSASNAQTFFTVNRLCLTNVRHDADLCRLNTDWRGISVLVSVKSVLVSEGTSKSERRVKKEGYLTHGVDALTEASDEGRRRLR